MQISHVLKKEYLPERFDTLAVAALWIVSIAVRTMSGSKFHYLAMIAMAVSMFDCVRFFVMMSNRMAKILNIKVFGYTVKDKKQ